MKFKWNEYDQIPESFDSNNFQSDNLFIPEFTLFLISMTDLPLSNYFPIQHNKKLNSELFSGEFLACPELSSIRAFK